MKTSKLIIIAVPVILALVVYLRISATDAKIDTRRQGPTLVKVELPKRQAIVQSLELGGDVLPIQQAQVFAKVSGNLESVKVNIGDYVRAYQLLAVIDTTELAQQYSQAAATYHNTMSTFERTKTLLDQNLAAKADFDDAKTAMQVAKSNFDAAQTRLSYAQITAPFSGYITQRYLDQGALVTSSNSTLFTLMDIEQVKVIVNVLEKDVPSVNDKTQATISVDAYPGRRFSGRVSRLSEALDLNTRTMPVEIDIPNTDHALKSGMFASVSLIIGQRADALTVPTQALLKDTRGTFVYVALQGSAHRKPVTVGTEQQSRTEIPSGLDAQDSVITTGQQFVKDGGAVIAQP